MDLINFTLVSPGCRTLMQFRLTKSLQVAGGQFGFTELRYSMTPTSNMSPVYGFSSVIGELGTSDYKMVLLVPAWYPTLDTGMIQEIVTRRMGKTERAMFTSTLAQIRWVFVHTAYVRGTVYLFPRNCGPFIGYILSVYDCNTTEHR